MNNKPIGVFDSGIGGLTVVKEIIKLLPNEDILYVGDTARVPYGTRGKEVITRFSCELTRYLLVQNVKCIVVACNTVSAICLADLQKLTDIPVLGVIIPASETIIKTTRSNHIGIIGTPATINSNAYDRELKRIDPTIQIVKKACPLFVPIAEEGFSDSQIAQITAQHYLSNLAKIDTLHLGCTHYPLLKKTIQNVVGPNVTIVDSAKPVSEKLKQILTSEKLLTSSSKKGKYSFHLTDVTDRTNSIAELFLGINISEAIKKITINE